MVTRLAISAILLLMFGLLCALFDRLIVAGHLGFVLGFLFFSRGIFITALYGLGANISKKEPKHG